MDIHVNCATERMNAAQSMDAIRGETGLKRLGERFVNCMGNLIEYAENRLNEATKQNENRAVTQYWVGYIDGIRAAQRELERDMEYK